jgi:phage I-like protein
MNFQQMKATIGLPEDASDEAVAGAVGNLIAVVASANKTLAEQQKQIDALMQMPKVGVVSVTAPGDEDDDGDSKRVSASAKSAPIPDINVILEMKEELAQVKAQLARERAERNAEQLETLLAKAEKDGKLVTKSEIAWARKMGKEDIGKLQEYLAIVQARPAFTSSQTGAHGMDLDEESGLTASQQVIARNLGITADQYKAQLKAKGAN